MKKRMMVTVLAALLGLWLSGCTAVVSYAVYKAVTAKAEPEPVRKVAKKDVAPPAGSGK